MNNSDYKPKVCAKCGFQTNLTYCPNCGNRE